MGSEKLAFETLAEGLCFRIERKKWHITWVGIVEWWSPITCQSPKKRLSYRQVATCKKVFKLFSWRACTFGLKIQWLIPSLPDIPARTPQGPTKLRETRQVYTFMHCEMLWEKNLTKISVNLACVTLLKAEGVPLGTSAPPSRSPKIAAQSWRIVTCSKSSYCSAQSMQLITTNVDQWIDLQDQALEWSIERKTTP